MVETRAHFSNRLTKLGRKHRSMQDGYVNILTRDGLIVAQPRRQPLIRATSGFTLIAASLLIFFLFKAIIFASIGPANYADRIALLESGTVVEQWGAVAMAPDLVTQQIAKFVGPFLK